MDNIKMETDYRLETIFVSLTKDTKNKLNDILKVKEIDNSILSKIHKYLSMLDSAGTLSIETLKREFPDLYFEESIPLSGEALDDYIRLFITDRKNAYISNSLLNLANLVKTNGLTESVINKLNYLTKSDTVYIKHTSIEDEIIDIYKKKIPESGLNTGIKRIDSDTGGLQPGTLVTILGFTGSFKTTWALNIAYNAANNEKNVLYLSLEVTKENIMYNLLSRHSVENKFTTHIEHLDLKHKKLSDEDFKYLEHKIYPDYLKLKGKIEIIDETELESYSFFSLENKFREIDKILIDKTGHGVDLLVVDHAQLLKFDQSMKGIGNETNVVNAYISFFRQCALNWIKTGRQITVLMLSQSSREGWKEAAKNEGAYKLTALAEANELERASSLVLSVFSSESLKQVKSAKVQILKNRDGNSWSEPMEVFVDPVYYLFGDNGTSADISEKFSISDMSMLFNHNEEEDLELQKAARLDLDELNLNI